MSPLSIASEMLLATPGTPGTPLVGLSVGAFAVLFALTTLGHATQSMIGFGAAFLPVALGAVLLPLLPLAELKLLVVILNLPLALHMALRGRAQIRWRALLWPTLPLYAAGLAVGLVVTRVVSPAAPKLVVGIVVTFVAVRELARAWSRSTAPPAGSTSSWWLPSWLSLGSVMQGAWAAGTPVTVLALLGKRWTRDQLLATVSALWTFVYGALLAVHVVDGSVTASTWTTAAWLVPAVALGAAVGEVLRRVVPERPFRVVLFTLLTAAGAALATSGAALLG